MKTTTIKLTTPITGHEAPVTEIEVRAPNLVDFFELGEPWTSGRSESGVVIPAENDAAIDAYMRRLVVQPKDKLILSQVGLADAMRLKEAILDFFVEARLANQSHVSPTSS